MASKNKCTFSKKGIATTFGDICARIKIYLLEVGKIRQKMETGVHRQSSIGLFYVCIYSICSTPLMRPLSPPNSKILPNVFLWPVRRQRHAITDVTRETRRLACTTGAQFCAIYGMGGRFCDRQTLSLSKVIPPLFLDIC